MASSGQSDTNSIQFNSIPSDTKTSEHRCVECGIQFDSPESLQVHLQYHNKNLLTKWNEDLNEKNGSIQFNSDLTGDKNDSIQFESTKWNEDLTADKSNSIQFDLAAAKSASIQFPSDLDKTMETLDPMPLAPFNDNTDKLMQQATSSPQTFLSPKVSNSSASYRYQPYPLYDDNNSSAIATSHSIQFQAFSPPPPQTTRLPPQQYPPQPPQPPPGSENLAPPPSDPPPTPTNGGEEIWDLDSNTVKRYNVMENAVPPSDVYFGGAWTGTGNAQPMYYPNNFDSGDPWLLNSGGVAPRAAPPDGAQDPLKRPKSYQCEACDKWFTSSGHLKRHYNTTLHKNAMRQRGLTGKQSPFDPFSENSEDRSISTFDSTTSSHLSPMSPSLTSGPSAASPAYYHHPSPTNPSYPSPGPTNGSPSKPELKRESPLSMSPHSIHAMTPLGSDLLGSDRTPLGSADLSDQPEQQQNHQNIKVQTPTQQYGTAVPTSNTSSLMFSNGIYPDPHQQQPHHNQQQPHHNQQRYQNTHMTPYSQALTDNYNTFTYSYNGEYHPHHHHHSSQYDPVLSSPAQPQQQQQNHHMTYMHQIQPPSAGGGSFQTEQDFMQTVQTKKSKELFLQDLDHDENSTATPPLTTGNNGSSTLDTGDFRCNECNKSFNRLCYLKQHNKSFHNGEKPYKCGQCGKRFPVEVLYQEHLAKHAGDKPYKCEVCPKQFNHKTDLRRHMCLHTGEKPFSCDVCGKGFIREDRMIKHSDTHKKKQAIIMS